MKRRDAATVGVIVAALAILYVPVSMVVVGMHGTIEGNVEKSFVVVPALGGIIGYVLAVLATDARASPSERRRIEGAKIASRMALLVAAFFVCFSFLGGVLLIR